MIKRHRSHEICPALPYHPLMAALAVFFLFHLDFFGDCCEALGQSCRQPDRFVCSHSLGEGRGGGGGSKGKEEATEVTN